MTGRNQYFYVIFFSLVTMNLSREIKKFPKNCEQNPPSFAVASQCGVYIYEYLFKPTLISTVHVFLSGTEDLARVLC